MDIIAEGCSIVIVGFWNPMIFNEKWIKSNIALSDDAKVTIEFPVNSPQLPPRFSFDDVYLYVTESRLQINPCAPQSNAFENMNLVAIRILDTLSHTPVSAVGANFIFVENSPSKKALTVFDLGDKTHLEYENLTAEQVSIGRTFRQDDIVLTIKLEKNSGGNGLQVYFNYHKDVSGPDDARGFLKPGTTSYIDSAKSLLKRLYDLEATND